MNIHRPLHLLFVYPRKIHLGLNLCHFFPPVPFVAVARPRLSGLGVDLELGVEVASRVRLLAVTTKWSLLESLCSIIAPAISFGGVT